jgi:hypothetical protein
MTYVIINYLPTIYLHIVDYELGLIKKYSDTERFELSI